MPVQSLVGGGALHVILLMGEQHLASNLLLFIPPCLERRLEGGLVQGAHAAALQLALPH